MKRILIAPVRFYQRFISPAFPPSCRFEPTCSNYMIQAIEKHGFKGVLMGLARILRCHPWSKTGKDPVPDHFSLKRNQEGEWGWTNRFQNDKNASYQVWVSSIGCVLSCKDVSWYSMKIKKQTRKLAAGCTWFSKSMSLKLLISSLFVHLQSWVWLIQVRLRLDTRGLVLIG